MRFSKLLTPNLYHATPSSLLEVVSSQIQSGPVTVITGPNVRRLPLVNNLIESIYKAYNVTQEVIVDSQFPVFQTLGYKEEAQLIAVGGGKILDSAKLMSLEINRDEFEQSLLFSRYSFHRRHHILFVPTTVGNGSEATHFAVCYRNGEKHSYAHPSLIPDVVVYCADLLSSMSRETVVAGLLDATCHGIESLFSKSANDLSSKLAMNALDKLLPFLWQVSNSNEAVSLPPDVQSACRHAGAAINIAKTNVPHALSYYLARAYNLEHGLSVALFMSDYINMLINRRSEMGSLFSQRLDLLFNLMKKDCENIDEYWQLLMRRLSIQHSEFFLNRKEISYYCIRHVNRERLHNFILSMDDGILFKYFCKYSTV